MLYLHTVQPTPGQEATQSSSQAFLFLNNEFSRIRAKLKDDGYTNISRPQTPLPSPRCLDSSKIPAVSEAYKTADSNFIDWRMRKRESGWWRLEEDTVGFGLGGRVCLHVR